MSFAKMLDRLMTDNNVSNSALGRACGISDVSVGKWRKGESSPSFDNAISIAKFFSITLDQLAEIKPLFESQGKVRLPVIGSVSMYGVFRTRLYAEEYITVEREEIEGYAPEECFALAVKDRTIDGAPYLLFHQQKQCANEELVIVEDNVSHEVMFRKFCWLKDKINLVAPNPDFKDVIYPKQEINRLDIQAVYIGDYAPV